MRFSLGFCVLSHFGRLISGILTWIFRQFVSFLGHFDRFWVRLIQILLKSGIFSWSLRQLVSFLNHFDKLSVRLIKKMLNEISTCTLHKCVSFLGYFDTDSGSDWPRHRSGFTGLGSILTREFLKVQPNASGWIKSTLTNAVNYSPETNNPVERRRTRICEFVYKNALSATSTLHEYQVLSPYLT